MRARPLPLLLLGALGVASLLVWWLTRGEEPGALGPAPPAAGTAAEPEPAAPPAEPTSDALVPARVERAEQAPEAPEGPPPSYRRHLSGFRGRVVEPDGTPVADLLVELLGVDYASVLPPLGSLFAERPPEPPLVLDSVETDAEGRFEFLDVEPRGLYGLALDPEGPRADLRFLDRGPEPGEIVDLGDIRLDSYVVFTGRVTDERGAPVSGAVVQATQLPSILFAFGLEEIRFDVLVAGKERRSAPWRVVPLPSFVPRLARRLPIPTARTDAEGRFRVEGVPIGLITVLVRKDGLVPRVEGPVASGQNGERDLGTIVLEDGETLSGRVIDEEERPVAGAEVAAGPRFDAAPLALLRPIGVTDEDGRFEAGGFSDRDHVIAVRRPGTADWTVVPDVVPGIDEVEVRLAAGRTLTVRVFDPEGRPLRRADVALQPAGGMPLHPLLVAPVPLSGRLERLDDGAIRIRDLDPLRYVVTVRAEGFVVGRAEADLREGSGEVRVSLAPELAAEVYVVDAASGAPVEYALVSVFDPKAEREEFRTVPIATRRTDADGRCRIGGLAPGSFVFSALHPAYAEHFERVRVPGGPFTLALRPGGSIQGVVVENGVPVREQRFVATGQEDRFPRMTVTEPDGRFHLGKLEPGQYTLVVMRRFADKSLASFFSGPSVWQGLMPERVVEATVVEGAATEVVIDLLRSDEEGPKARLSGWVLWNGLPAAGLPVMAFTTGEEGLRSVSTDERGRFDFGEVPAGRVYVQVARRGARSGFEYGHAASAEVDLSPGEARELRFEIRTGRLQGRVVRAGDETPVFGAAVTVRSEEGRGARVGTLTDRTGGFAFEDLPAGRYRVSVRREGFAPASVSGIEVSPGGAPPPVLLRVVPGVRISGRVIWPPDRERPRFLFLSFEDPDTGENLGGAGVDRRDFEFASEGMRPGRVRIRIFGPGGRYAPVEVTVPPNGLSNLEIEPTPLPQEEEQSVEVIEDS